MIKKTEWNIEWNYSEYIDYGKRRKRSIKTESRFQASDTFLNKRKFKLPFLSQQFFFFK